jgi:death-on-curing family protein
MSSTAAKTFRFLTSIQVNRLHQIVIAKRKPSQPAMLESAVASPMNVKYYEKEENIFQLATNLAEKIMKNHAYQDGNKRTALLAADMFFKINGYKLQRMPMAHDDVNNGITNAHVAVTTNQWNAKQLGEYYESIATPIESWTANIMEYRNCQ